MTGRWPWRARRDADPEAESAGWAEALARIEARLGPVALRQVPPLDYGGEGR